MPTLSIVIPTYNEETTLPLLLASIDHQSFTDYEIIVADNNSTDNTRSIADEYGARVVDGGMPSVGRNSGAKAANGKIILFLDADTILPSGFLSDIVSEFRSHDLDIATPYIRPISNRFSDIWMHDFYNAFISLSAKWFPIAPGICIMVDHLVHDMINGFDETVVLGEDTDYMQRAAKVGKFGVLKNIAIDVSVRRLDRDGRFVVAVKYILAGLYMMVFGK